MSDTAADLQVVPADDTVVLIQDDDVEDASAADRDHEDNEDFNEISVPLTVVLSVIGGYIIIGTVIFGLWEDWKMETAAYYCFITISTIGFGDVVPSLTEDQYKLIAVSFYMLFGMATLSMCFTLVQDQMAAKFRLMGQKFGLLSRFKDSSHGEDSRDDGVYGDVRSGRSGGPGQPVATVPAAGTEVFEMRRRKRVQRLKFRWIRQQLSGKDRARHRRRTSSSVSMSPGDESRPRSDSVFETVVTGCSRPYLLPISQTPS